jgi:signal peptidase I
MEDAPLPSPDLLAQSGELRLRVEGESMAPALLAGDVVRIAKLTSEGPEPGDIVLLRSGTGAPALHRVIARRKAGAWLIVTAGDATGRLDAVLPASQVIGRVVGVRREGHSLAVPMANIPWRLRLRASLKLLLRRPKGSVGA